MSIDWLQHIKSCWHHYPPPCPSCHFKPDLVLYFPSAIHPWSIIVGQGRGREWIKVVRESLTRRYWRLPSKIVWCQGTHFSKTLKDLPKLFLIYFLHRSSLNLHLLCYHLYWYLLADHLSTSLKSNHHVCRDLVSPLEQRDNCPFPNFYHTLFPRL